MHILSAVWRYLFSREIGKWHFPLLVIMTIILMTIAGIVHVPGVMTGPQFTQDLTPEFVKTMLTDNQWHEWAFHWYFIVDTLWAPILLLAIVKFVRRNAYPRPLNPQQKFWIALYGVAALAAYVFDVIENYHYYTCYCYPELISKIKIGLYVLVLIIWLWLLIRKYKDQIFPALKDFIYSAWISLLILLVIGAVLPKAPQVNSIVVNLYDHPFNFIFLLAFAPIYAVMLAHYPSYFNIKSDHRTWYRAEHFKLGLFGTIFYKYKEDYTESFRGKTESIANFLFRVLGVLFYVALFYLVAYTSEVNFDWPWSMNDMAIGLLFIGVYLLYLLKNQKNKWLNKYFVFLHHKLPDFYDGDLEQSDATKTQLANYNLLADKTAAQFEDLDNIDSIKYPVMVYLGFLILTILSHLALFYFLFDQNFTQLTSILALSCIALQMVTFIYFRTFRSVFRFTFYNENIPAVLNSFFVLRKFDVTIDDVVTEEEIRINKNKILDFFTTYKFNNSLLFNWFSKLGFGLHSNNIFFLQFTGWIGIANMIFFIIINVFSRWTLSLNINAILIILSAFFLYYGIIIVIVKNYIYYKYSTEIQAKNRRKAYFGMLWMGLIVMAGLYFAARIVPNNLFTLKPVALVETSESNFELKDYVNNLTNGDEPRYYIGAYGGGMKANAWTLTVLNTLYQKDSTFFNKTIGMSGASGGTIGIINMAAIMGQKNLKPEKWEGKIDTISTENFLSLDLAHILGRDLLNTMFIPGGLIDLQGKDRSSKAMYQYGKLVHDADKKFKDIAYLDYWSKLYKQHDKHFPILLTNTTNVSGNHGISVSVPVDRNSLAYSYLYQGADNVLDLGKKSLSYYDAASTSNRFPLISPAAKIETKGHYNDGGIYENSGLLSAYKLSRAINEPNGILVLDSLKQKQVFINIVNDKNLYIKHYLRQYLDTLKVIAIHKSSEIDAVLNSVASTEMGPIFIKKELERLGKQHPKHFSFKSIYLPHRFTVENIKSIFGKELSFESLSESKTIEVLYKLVQENNHIIDSIIRPNNNYQIPVVEPPMSRVLAKGAYQFMLEMLKHPITSDAIDEILETGQ